MTDATIHRAGRRPRGFQLPVDLLLEITGRTDPATVIRCAATCKELRRHIADPAFHGCLRLRHNGRFIRALLVDNATQHATNLLLSDPKCEPVTARRGLVLLRVSDGLCVCSLATGHRQALPPGPPYRSDFTYALIVGDGAGSTSTAVGRPFQVLRINPSFVPQQGQSCLRIQTFSSEKGNWSPVTDVLTPLRHGSSGLRRQSKYLVIGDTVHWLCYRNHSYCVLQLHTTGGQTRVTIMELPPSFQRASHFVRARTAQILLATETVEGSPVVLVASNDMISSWVPSNLTEEQPQVVIKNEALLSFAKVNGLATESLGRVRLGWFAQMSGVVIISTPRCGFFWLDLGSREIFGWSKSCRAGYPTRSYEIELSSWVPSLSPF